MSQIPLELWTNCSNLMGRMVLLCDNVIELKGEKEQLMEEVAKFKEENAVNKHAKIRRV